MATWTQIEDALTAWVRTASGLADGKVIFAEQDVPEPALPYVTVRIGPVLPVGQDELSTTTDLGRAAGQEIEMKVTGVREFSVSIQSHTDQTTGAGTSRETLAKIQTSLKLPTVRDGLNAVGLSPFDIGQIQNVSLLVQTKFEHRSILEVRFYSNETLSEYTGYINTVSLVDYTGNDTIDF